MNGDFASLSRSDLAEFRKALLSVYPNKKDLILLLKDEFSFIASEKFNTEQGSEYLTDEIIDEFKARGELLELIATVKKKRGENYELSKFCSRVSSTAGYLERPEIRDFFHKNSKIVNPDQFGKTLLKCERQVGSIQIRKKNGDTEIGTGFLVGPRVLLTNYHVVECIIDRKNRQKSTEKDWADPSDFACQFDYFVTPKSRTIRDAVKCRLIEHDDWCLLHSKDSYVDKHPTDDTHLPKPNELDFALLVLDREVGKGTISTNEKAHQRGWIKIPNIPRDFEKGDPVMILQCPEGAPLNFMISMLGIKGLNSQSTRLYYYAKTNYGSSGSPCFDINWNLIALHSARDEEANYAEDKIGIPITAVWNAIKGKDIDVENITIKPSGKKKG